MKPPPIRLGQSPKPAKVSAVLQETVRTSEHGGVLASESDPGLSEQQIAEVLILLLRRDNPGNPAPANPADHLHFRWNLSPERRAALAEILLAAAPQYDEHDNPVNALMSDLVADYHRFLATRVWVERAQNLLPLRDGELEMDNDALVSLSSDNGAYVQTWSWVEGPTIGDDP